MKGMVPMDPQTSVSQPQYAIVYVPKRSRKRFAASNVEILESKAQAIEQANPDEKRFAAVVIGPSKSSEGQYIYYLGEWL